tara:strand:- start:506 stop:1228 length:723 start_codon:yes stop_codon:yes gene_type:complete
MIFYQSILKYISLIILIGLVFFLLHIMPGSINYNDTFFVHYKNQNYFTKSASNSIEELITQFVSADSLNKDINTHVLEELIDNSIYVDKAEVYLNIRGELNVDIDFRQPFLILLREDRVLYFDNHGVILPSLSDANENFLVLSGDFKNDKIKEVLSLINQIYDHPVLNKLIGGVHYKEEDGYTLSAKTCDLGINIGFNPLVRKTQIDVIDLFYDFLLFRLNCDYCQSINITYDKQIICIK